ncbi:MAG TPA: hypothetical protein VL994_05710 [Steroidobacteraceae bacterium]|nr:hypothetical protein [Steroidobacteraceae bacterium]
MPAANKPAVTPGIFRYERSGDGLLPRREFYLRLMRHLALALVLLAVSLWIGMLGYEHFEHLEWHDAFENACMLLGGMGPVNNPTTNAGKLFAGWYALYAGLVFLVVASIILAPVLHRMLHLFHADEHDK